MDVIEVIKNRKISKGPDGRAFKLSKKTSLEAIQKVEKEFGFSLPPLLKAIYCNAGNGGFGPGYGVMGVPGGLTDDQGSNILSLYKSYCEPDPYDPSWQWQEGLVPICHLGCVIYTCVNCLEPSYPVYSADIGVIDEDSPLEANLILVSESFDSWVESWI